MTIRLAAMTAVCALLSACATPLAEHQQTFENVQLLRSNDIAPMALGAFGLAPGIPASLDKSVGIRGGGVTPPPGLTFSGYLKQTLEAELTGAGKLGPGASTVLSGDLTQSSISTLGSMSKGTLGARFSVTRSGSEVFDKELAVTEEWPSAFFGFEAITTATNHYNAFYPKLVTKLLSDPEFRKAVNPQ